MSERLPAWVPWSLLGLFLLGWGLRAATTSQFEAHHPLADRPVIDEKSYETWALEIAAGDWVGDEVFFQEPLYPYALAVSYRALGLENRAGVRQLQAFLGALVIPLVWGVTRRLFGWRAGLVAALAIATYRPLLLLPSLLLKPNLVLPLLGLLAWALVGRADSATLSKRRWLLVGVCAGAGALLRGNVVLLLPALVVWPLLRSRLEPTPRPELRSERPWWRRGLLDSALVVLGISVFLLPVAVRNYAVGGELVLTTSGAGTNLYGGNNAENPDGRATEFSWVRGIPEYEADDWRHEAERRVGRTLTPKEVSRYWIGETWRSVRSEPALHLSILWNKLRLTLGAYEVPDNHHLEWDARYVSLLRLPWPGFALWGGAGLAGLALFAFSARVRRESGVPPLAGWELAFLLAAYIGTIVITVTSMRARLALLPFLIPFAGLFVDRLLRRGSRNLAAVTGLLALGFVWWPVYSDAELAEDLDKRDFNLAVYLAEAGDYEGAGAIAAELGARHPKSSRVLSLQAELAFEQGRRLRLEGREEEGREAIRAALFNLELISKAKGVPPREQHRVRRIGAAIQEYLGNARAAANHYRAALEFDPEDPAALEGLARCQAVLDAESTTPGSSR